RNISDMAGIGRRLPWTMGAFFVGSLSMIGVPPTAGFVSKWYLALGSVEAGEIAFLIVLLVSSVLNAAYFLPVSYVAFFGTDAQEWPATVHEIPMVTIPLVATAILSVSMGIFPGYFLALAEGVVR
ncbi:MAG: monovalent cation/H+ antiporter subunit D family protein, partial [Mesorhizobium sp.]